jgi:hypothetical protein
MTAFGYCRIQVPYQAILKMGSPNLPNELLQRIFFLGCYDDYEKDSLAGRKLHGLPYQSLVAHRFYRTFAGLVRTVCPLWRSIIDSPGSTHFRVLLLGMRVHLNPCQDEPQGEEPLTRSHRIADEFREHLKSSDFADTSVLMRITPIGSLDLLDEDDIGFTASEDDEDLEWSTFEKPRLLQFSLCLDILAEYSAQLIELVLEPAYTQALRLSLSSLSSFTTAPNLVRLEIEDCKRAALEMLPKEDVGSAHSFGGSTPSPPLTFAKSLPHLLNLTNLQEFCAGQLIGIAGMQLPHRLSSLIGRAFIQGGPDLRRRQWKALFQVFSQLRQCGALHSLELTIDTLGREPISRDIGSRDFARIRLSSLIKLSIHADDSATYLLLTSLDLPKLQSLSLKSEMVTRSDIDRGTNAFPALKQLSAHNILDVRILGLVCSASVDYVELDWPKAEIVPALTALEPRTLRIHNADGRASLTCLGAMSLARLETLHLHLQSTNWEDSLDKKELQELTFPKLRVLDLGVPKYDRNAYRFILQQASSCTYLEEVNITCAFGGKHRQFWKEFRGSLERAQAFHSVRKLGLIVNHALDRNDDNGSVTVDLLSCFPSVETLSIGYITQNEGLWQVLDLFHEGYAENQQPLPTLRNIDIRVSGGDPGWDGEFLSILEKKCSRTFLIANRIRSRLGCSLIEEVVVNPVYGPLDYSGDPSWPRPPKLEVLPGENNWTCRFTRDSNGIISTNSDQPN